MTLEEYYTMLGQSEPETPVVRSADVMSAIFSRANEAREMKLAKQVKDALEGLAELKRVNSIYPTPKRTKAIEEIERRYRNAGILD